MENENNYYTQPDSNPQPEQGGTQYGNQTYGQADQQYTGQTYGQGEPQYGNQTYGQGEPQYGNQAYGQPNPQFGSQAYGQGEPQYGNQAYGQPNPQFGYNPNMGYGMSPIGQNGQPLKNRFGMKLTFSILEIISCNLITIILGIIGCVFTVKANNSYKSGRWEDFKSEAKTSAICLWVGLGAFVLGTIFGVALWAMENVGNNPGDVYVYVDGTCIEVPIAYDDMEDLGFSLDAYDAGTMLGANGDFGLYQMVNEDGDYVMWCWFANDSSRRAPLEECEIIGIDVDSYCDNYETYRTSKGLGFFDSKEDFIDAYGRPDKSYSEGSSEQLYWYLDDGSDPVWKVMEVTFVDGELYDIDIDYWK